MSRNIELVDSVQDLLDAGYNRNKIATLLGVHHQVVTRLINSFNIEAYQPFDDAEDHMQLVMNFEWLYEEDVLEEIFRRAFDGEIVTMRNDSEDYTRLLMYLRERYGGIVGYIKEKRLYPLIQYIHKKCSRCDEYRPLTDFTRDARNLWMLNCFCNKCKSSFIDKEKNLIYTNNRRALTAELPYSWTHHELKELIRDFPRCWATGRREVAYDHFIAVKTGHGGTYKGNMIPLNKSDNSSKSSRNPFTWIKSSPIPETLFSNVVMYLAEQNGLTFDEYRQFVDWCYANQRSIDDIRADNERYGYVVSSLELWREATGIAFPLRLDLRNSNETKRESNAS